MLFYLTLKKRKQIALFENPYISKTPCYGSLALRACPSIIVSRIILENFHKITHMLARVHEKAWIARYLIYFLPL
jgi:hypothetical protein